MPFIPEHLNAFANAGFQQQGPVGFAPSEWVEEMEIDVQGFGDLPDDPLKREQVLKHCEAPRDVLHGYLCVMAWGAQGLGPSGARNAVNAWNHNEQIRRKLEELRQGELSRQEAYDLFAGGNAVPGLGPAYFTKLLHFFHQAGKCYIMDQWTTKSVILLTGLNIIRHTNLGPTNSNTGDNYELFCRVIDQLAHDLDVPGENPGGVIEQRLFSVGSMVRQPRGPWRRHVHEAWPNRPALGRYNRAAINDLLAQPPPPEV